MGTITEPKEYIFVVWPNNSGSTLMQRYLNECKNVVGFAREGQHLINDVSIILRPTQVNMSNLWYPLADFYACDRAYNWGEIKSRWLKRWRQNWLIAGNTKDSFHNATCLEKSPTNVARVHLLKKHFPNSKFLFGLRNPFAMAEGIYRKGSMTSQNYTYKEIGKHIVKMFELQFQNIENFENEGLFFTYEKFCENPNKIKEKLVEFSDSFVDVDFSKKTWIKHYNEPIRNMNQDQIDRISDRDRDILFNVFTSHSNYFIKFGYI